MILMEAENQNKLERAKKRVEEIKGFYIHLAVYVVIIYPCEYLYQDNGRRRNLLEILIIFHLDILGNRTGLSLGSCV